MSSARRFVRDRLVAARDVVADPGWADVVGVGDGAADRLRVADVAVGAERAAQRVAGVGAALELLDGARRRRRRRR